MVRAKVYRARARESLGTKWLGPTWGLALAIMFLCNLVIGIPFVGFILMGPLAVSIAKSFYDLATKKEQQKIEHLLYGIQNDFIGNFVLALLQTLYIMLWSMLFTIPGIIKSYSYSMAYFIKQRNPKLDYSDCITESRKLMKGNKWRLFCLDLSFLGWNILSLFTLLVLQFWIRPYHHMARTEFFIDLVGEVKIDKQPEPTNVEVFEEASVKELPASEN